MKIMNAIERIRTQCDGNANAYTNALAMLWHYYSNANDERLIEGKRATNKP